jgi:hypothetical protein
VCEKQEIEFRRLARRAGGGVDTFVVPCVGRALPVNPCHRRPAPRVPGAAFVETGNAVLVLFELPARRAGGALGTSSYHVSVAPIPSSHAINSLGRALSAPESFETETPSLVEFERPTRGTGLPAKISSHRVLVMAISSLCIAIGPRGALPAPNSIKTVIYF